MTKSKHLIYLTLSGQIHFIFFEKEKKPSELIELQLKWTVDLPVSDIDASYLFLAIVIEESDIKKRRKISYLLK
jgi:hypothetical protein